MAADVSSSFWCVVKSVFTYSHIVSFSADELINAAFYPTEFFRR